ncbi:hypothetical protein MH117_10810 [Paenibacillus sp. ACRRX]|uniref:hypothetical protein n=1 Tax=unclassified Paenibacillus TaxID=185978 RepID=UPI001EF4468E|nr:MULTISPECIES: hypothetical protein [unclassified Paenibacillus]MCG7407911.1 hypothetical protein [Paenibacillus sp. ACRRX]MDK8181054.1 hypothetical protein [Paenibacillus sp. UMB4589-SE434]
MQKRARKPGPDRSTRGHQHYVQSSGPPILEVHKLWLDALTLILFVLLVVLCLCFIYKM